MCDISEKNYTSPAADPPRQRASCGSNYSNSSEEAARAKEKQSTLTCPGKPVVLPTACGITRHA